MNLSIKEAEYVLTILAEGNLTRAAQKLYIAQPSLTQLLQKLEIQMGTKIFYRNGRDYVPTQAGNVLVEACQKICKISRDLENRIQDFSQKHQRTVIVGAPFNIGAYLFPRLFQIYRDECPDTQFIPVEARSAELEKDLLESEIDLAVMPLSTDKFNSEIRHAVLMKEHMVMSVPKGHSLNGKCKVISGERYPYIDVSLTDGENYILSAPGQKLFDVCRKIFSAAKIIPHPIFVSRSFEAKKRLSAAGMGLTIFPEHYHEFYQSPGEANYYYLLPPCDFTWDIAVFYREEDLSAPVIKQCIKILMSIFSRAKFSIHASR